MSLGLVITRLAQHLSASLASPPAARIGGGQPLGAADVPSLVLAIRDASDVPSGVGNLPRPTQRKPLLATTTVDLGDPVVHFPGEDFALLSDGGRVLRLPHGPLVHPDGTAPPPPLDGGALRLTLDTTELTCVSGVPGANEFRFDRAAALALGYGDPDSAGVVRFAAPLTGSQLVARYFVGEYEVTAARYRGVLDVDVVASTAATVESLSESVAGTLRRGVLASLATAHALVPTAWGPIGLADTGLGGARRRTLTYRFDLEVEEAVLPTSGGRVARVDVTTTLDLGSKPPPPLPTDTAFSVEKREETP